MTKRVIKTHLAAEPSRLTDIFNLLQQAGARHFALFGGAIRDADFAARNGQEPRINDYDLRVWLESKDHETHVARFLDGLRLLSDQAIEHAASAGTGRALYRLDFAGAALDISIRAKDLRRNPPVESVAIDRARDSDIGLCSVAIDPSGQAWATPEYEQDQADRTLTIYTTSDIDRRLSYTARMQGKFPGHDLIWEL